MNCFLCLSRRLNSLNKSLFCNKFDLNSVNCKLNSNQFVLRTLSNQYVFNNVEELEDSYKSAKKTGAQTTHLLKRLILSYLKKYEHLKGQNTNRQTIVSRVKQIAEEMNENENQTNDALNASLIEFFTDCDDLESALKVKNRISPNFRLDSFKVFNLAALLVKRDKTNAAINLIETQLSEHRRNDKHFRDNRQDFKKLRDQSINRLLNTLIDKQIQTDVIRKVFEICVQMNATKVNKMIAGPLIKMHLVNGDVSAALEEYLSCALNYGVIPWSIELMRIFIQNKDEKSLHTVVKKSTNIYGPHNTALDLSAAYLYNGLEDKAKQELNKIPRIQQKSIELICDKFVRDQKFQCFETILLMTQSIDGIDRQKLFTLLINAYKRSGQSDKALHVLNIMKEQNIEPKEETLKLDVSK